MYKVRFPTNGKYARARNIYSPNPTQFAGVFVVVCSGAETKITIMSRKWVNQHGKSAPSSRLHLCKHYTTLNLYVVSVCLDDVIHRIKSIPAAYAIVFDLCCRSYVACARARNVFSLNERSPYCCLCVCQVGMYWYRCESARLSSQLSA